jgi:phosphotransferase system enzyme I (PtsP)
MTLMAGTGPRVLLRRMRELMAEPISPQTRLDRLAQLIAGNMVAEVCSIYLMRADKSLELFATEGLNPSAVHKTRLKSGEGLVGVIAITAQPLNLSDAQSHPSFAYRPETGEDPFQSLMGVPVLRGGRTLGVLAVQNRTKRHYEEEEVEALQIIATVLAELVISGALIDPAALEGVDAGTRLPLHYKGLALADGIAMGYVVLHEPRVAIGQLIAEDIAAERIRLDEGIVAIRRWVDDMLSSGEFAYAGEHRDVLEAYRMFAEDRGWLDRLREAVESGLTAEAGVERVQNETRARMLRLTDPYLRERLHDLDDLSNRLLRQLTGRSLTAAGETIPEDSIVCARTMGPAELLDYDRKRLRGLVVEEGSPTAHVAIVARALGIPMVGQLEGLIERLNAGDAIIADGDSGELYARPQQDVISAYAEKARFRARKQAQYAEIRAEPARTLDGVDVALCLNAGLLVDLPQLEQSGAAGIGLFRTELQFMVSATMPGLKAQTSLYRGVLDAAGDKPVVFRTLDLGGDKLLPYMTQMREENPALGWRAIRIALDRPALLRYQIRAFLAAAEDRALSIMFPMIAEVSEFVDARALVDREIARRARLGQKIPAKVRVGAMLEVPSLAWQLDGLCKLADFVSIGSNDLQQFFFASDRGNTRLAGRYDPLSPALLRFLRHIAETCRRHNVTASVCGEAMALIGIGFRSISMQPAGIGPVKMMLRSLELARLETVLGPMLESTAHSVRAQLQDFAIKEAVSI